MSTDYIPTTDAGKLAFAQNFSTIVSADAALLDVPPATATLLATKTAAYDAALTLATDPGTRGPATVLDKDLKRDDLISLIRQVGRQINANMAVSDNQRQALGLTIRKQPAPQPAPDAAPNFDVKSTTGRKVKAVLHAGGTPAKRGRPPGVATASVYSYVGTTPPPNIADWHFEANTSKTTVEIEFPSSTPGGAAVWLTACWNNARGMAGPLCAPVPAHLPGGGVSGAEAA